MHCLHLACGCRFACADAVNVPTAAPLVLTQLAVSGRTAEVRADAAAAVVLLEGTASESEDRSSAKQYNFPALRGCILELAQLLDSDADAPTGHADDDVRQAAANILRDMAAADAKAAEAFAAPVNAAVLARALRSGDDNLAASAAAALSNVAGHPAACRILLAMPEYVIPQLIEWLNTTETGCSWETRVEDLPQCCAARCIHRMLQHEAAAARRALAVVHHTRQRVQVCASSAKYPPLQQECQKILGML